MHADWGRVYFPKEFQILSATGRLCVYREKEQCYINAISTCDMIRADCSYLSKSRGGNGASYQIDVL